MGKQLILSFQAFKFLFGVCKLSHADGTLGTIEYVQKLLLHLPPAINGFWLQVSIPIKSYTLECPDELFYQ